MARTPNTRIPGEAPKLEEPVAAVADDVDQLPDADSIDPATLRKAVLTRQGWLCPSPPPDDGQALRRGMV